MVRDPASATRAIAAIAAAGARSTIDCEYSDSGASPIAATNANASRTGNAGPAAYGYAGTSNHFPAANSYNVSDACVSIFLATGNAGNAANIRRLTVWHVHLTVGTVSAWRYSIGGRTHFARE